MNRDWGRLPLYFEPNTGQFEPQVRYVARGAGQTTYLTDQEMIVVLTEASGATLRPETAPASAESALVRMKLSGSARPSQWSAHEKQRGVSNYFLGNDRSQWRTNVPHYGRVEARGVYPGVNLICYGSGEQFEYDLDVAPGADPSQIELSWDGVDSLRLSRNGDVVLTTKLGDVVQKRPHVYQEIAGRRVEVGSAYTLVANKRVRFQLAEFDRHRHLLIDPLVLIHSVAVSRDGVGDSGIAIAVDASGAAYVTGQVTGRSLVTKSPLQATYGGKNDAFVAKFTSGGTLLYATYLGGDDNEYGGAIAVDTYGSAYVTGFTISSNFPTQSPLQAVRKGNGDAFVTKLSPAGDALVYSTYLGGSDGESGGGIAVDSSGAAYVSGYTHSADFPVQSAYQNSFQGGTVDAFVTKIDAAGDALVYSTYLGGNGDDYGYGIALDSTGAAYVAGTTGSTNFPVLSPYQFNLKGSIDGFVTRLAPAGNALDYSTYIGGSGDDEAIAIAVDSSGAAYIAGYTTSTNYPVQSAYQISFGGGTQDGFVTKLASTGSTLTYSTYLGGGGADSANGIAVDASGSAYVTGFTISSDFPTKLPWQAANQGGSDIFLSIFQPAGTALAYSTYIGTSGSESARGIALDPQGGAYLTGTSPGSRGGRSNAFVDRVGISQGPPTVDFVSPSSGAGSSQTFSFHYSSAYGYEELNRVYALIGQVSGGSVGVPDSCEVKYLPASNALYLVSDSGSSSQGPVTIGTAGTLSNTQCTLDAGSSSVSGAGNALTLNLALTFKPAYAALKNTYGWAADNSGAASGWKMLGASYTADPPPPTADSVSPTSGTGASQAFTFRFSSTAGSGYLNRVYGSIGANANAAGSCRVKYEPGANGASGRLFLVTDDGMNSTGPLIIGQSGALSNSQCTLNSGSSSVSSSGNILALELALTFKPAFAGAKNIYGWAADNRGQTSGWVKLGTWTTGP